MGKITCANVISDLYAMGVCHIESIDVILKLSIEMTDKEQEVITALILRGFSESAHEAGSRIGRVTALVNPWCTIGGIATAVLKSNEYILPINAVAGDVLVLTKPLGTQIACAASTPARRAKLLQVATDTELEKLREQASQSMARLNRVAAQLIHRHSAHACTDVTGFGLLGHARNLASYQLNPVTFRINSLPIMENAVKIAQALGMKKLVAGISPETSGGLFISMAPLSAAAFCREIRDKEGCDAWIVGDVIEGEKTALLVENPQVVQVPFR